MPSVEEVRKLSQLYSTDVRQQEAILTQHYADAALFQDPLTVVHGRTAIARQFFLMTYLFSDIAVYLNSVHVSGKVAVIDNLQRYTLRGIPLLTFTIHAYSTYRFDDQGKVMRHEDSWSVADLISDLPLVGTLYNYLFRPLNALVGNAIGAALGH